MFGGVLNSLTRKLGQTATKSEAGKLAGLIGGEGAIAKSAPKMTEQVADQIIYHGTPNKFTKFNNDGGSTWFTSNKDKIKDSGLSWNGQGELNIMERKLPSDLKLANRELEDRYTRWELESMGYKGIKYDDIGPDEIYYELFEPNKLPLNEAVPEEAMAYLGGSAGSGNDLLKYMNATNPEFVAKKNLGAKTKTPAPRGRPTNEIRDSIAGTRIHPEDMDAMDQYIRYARNKKLRNSLPDDKQAKYELAMYDLAEHYGIKLNENATDPIRDMANRFIKAMDKQNVGGK